MSELSAGDEERIAEVRAWLTGGKKVAQVKEQLKGLGLNDYHISFILEEATGQSFVPSKPIVLIDTSQIRIIATSAALLIAALAAVWWLFLR